MSSCCPSGPDPARDCHPASAAGPGSLPAGLKHKEEEEEEEEGVNLYSSFTNVSIIHAKMMKRLAQSINWGAGTPFYEY